MLSRIVGSLARRDNVISKSLDRVNQEVKHRDGERRQKTAVGAWRRVAPQQLLWGAGAVLVAFCELRTKEGTRKWNASFPSIVR